MMTIMQKIKEIEDGMARTHKNKATAHHLGLLKGAQTIGMGQEAQSVAAAADLYNKANHILGYDLLDICVNGPKDKLDSTVISHVHLSARHLYLVF